MNKTRRRGQKARRVARHPDETKAVVAVAKPIVKLPKGAKRVAGKLTRSMLKLMKQTQAK